VSERVNDVSRRGFRLGKLGLSLTGSYLAYQMQNLVLNESEKQRHRDEFSRRASRKINDELGTLKGPIMKLGQILSMQTQALPPEAIGELANLQMRAPAMHPTLARAQFKASIGKYPEEVLREFVPEPFAAASLGQVHRAKTKQGERVVVKIQYPGIGRAVANDFVLLRSATLPARLTGHAPKGILDEIQRGFMEETDYLREAKNIDFFREALRSFEYLHIPTVQRALSTDRVLTMSFLEGSIIGEFLKHKPNQETLDLIGSRLFELYHYQIQCLRVLHADHQPGNYLFQDSGEIGLVDFGCVKHLTIDFADLSYCCVNRAWKEGRAQAAHTCQLIWGPRVPLQRAHRMLEGMEKFVDLLFPDRGKGERLVDFGRPDTLKAMMRCYGQAVKHRLTNPEFVFVSRVELGLCNLLHQLKARVNTRKIWERVHKQAFAISER